jgi:hypothetical protein
MRNSGALAPAHDVVISYEHPSGAQSRRTPYRTPLLDVDVAHRRAAPMRQRIPTAVLLSSVRLREP